MNLLLAQIQFAEVFSEVAAVLLLAAGVAAVGMWLRQPLIVSFIAVGILAGPSVLGWVTAKDEVDLLARLGIVLLLFVVVIMGAMGYSKRTGFLAGLTVAQISEFSLILGALGVGLGHLDAQIMGLITLVGLITISISSYMILYSHPLYELLAPWLGVFERKRLHREERPGTTPTMAGFEVILFGLGRFGTGIARELHHRGHRVLAVDFDPDLARRGGREQYPVHYGDAENTEFLETLPLASAQWIVSTISDPRVNVTLLHGLRRCACKAQAAVTAHHPKDAARLRDAGASLILMPYADGAVEAVDRLFGEPFPSPPAEKGVG